MKPPKPIEHASSPDLRHSWPALLRAARRAREVAARTDTAIVIVRDGVLEHVYPKQPVAASLLLQEPPAPYGDAQ